MRDFDINKVQSWSEALAICDLTKFLLAEPDLDSEFIISAAPDVSAGTLKGPYFVPTSNFYSKVMRLTFDKVEGAGQVTAGDYADARMRYTKLMFSSYRNASPADKVFLADQMKLCYALAVNTRQAAQGPAPKAH